MSYLRPLSLQPDSLKSACLDVWLRHLAGLIRDDTILSRRHRNRRLDDDLGGTERKMPHSISVQSFSENNKVLVIIDMKDKEPSDTEEANFDFQGETHFNIKSSRFLSQEYLRRYLNSMLPPALQEEAYHRGVQLLRKDFVAHNAFNNDLFPRFFGLMWRSTFKHLDLPPIKDVADRLGVLERVRDAFEDGKAIAERTETAKFRLFDNHNSGEPPDIEESYLMKRILRSMANLRVLVLWHVADDAILNIVGSTCLRLETLDLWKSSGVTDLGLKMMLTKDMDENYSKKMEFDELPPCCHTLMRLGLKETSVTHIGCLVALIRCANLEVLNFSHTSIVRDFYSEVQRLSREDEEEKLKEQKSEEESDESPRKRRRKKLWTKERGYGLKSLFLPLHQDDSFPQIIESFPKLEDLRLWTSINHLRDLEKYKLPASLRSLLLGGLHSSQILTDLISVIGVQLTTLKIETVLSAVPLHLVGETCPNLVELQVINGRLTCCDETVGDLRGRRNGLEIMNNPPLIAPTPKCISGKMPETYLAKLRLVYLFLVNYDDNNNNGGANPSGSDNALHCILKHARNIEAVQATGSSTFTDASLSATLKVNPMSNLKRFILTNASIAHTTNTLGHPGGNFSLENNLDISGERTSLALTKSSVLNLFERCKHLQCIGDLRHWSVTPVERRELTKAIAEKTDVRWIATSAH